MYITSIGFLTGTFHIADTEYIVQTLKYTQQCLISDIHQYRRQSFRLANIFIQQLIGLGWPGLSFVSFRTINHRILLIGLANKPNRTEPNGKNKAKKGN